MQVSRVYKFMIFYTIGLILLYLSVFLSYHISYNSYFISQIPIILPLVFSLVAIGISIIFLLGKNLPWFFRTGIMSLAIGVTLLFFSIVLVFIGDRVFILGGSFIIGIFFIIAAFVRLIIQGGLNAYRKNKN